MTLASGIDVQDSKVPKSGDVVLGDDWVAPKTTAHSEVRAKRARRGLISINRSPLARKIVMFNLMALIILVAGVLYLNPFRDSLVLQRESGLVTEAKLIANVLEAQLPVGGPVNLITGDGVDPAAALAALDLQTGVDHGVHRAAAGTRREFARREERVVDVKKDGA